MDENNLLSQLFGGTVDDANPLFDTSGWQPMSTLMDILEAVEAQDQVFKAHKMQLQETGEGCWAIDGYIEALPEVVAVAQLVMDNVSAFIAVSQLPLLEKALAKFNLDKTKAMAQCAKPGCTDRASAREELGWSDEEKTSQ